MPVRMDAHARRTVLYVEDNEVNAALMEALFERRPDLQLRLAPDCAAALRSARAWPPALFLLDLRLPDGDGAALLPHLRALPGLGHVPAVAVTAEDLRNLALTGFDDLWSKPLGLRQVLDRLEAWLPCKDRPDQGPAAMSASGGAFSAMPHSAGGAHALNVQARVLRPDDAVHQMQLAQRHA